MTIQLKKDQSLNLIKAVPGLSVIRVGLGWTIPNNQPKIDLDVSVLCLMNDGGVVRLPSDAFMVFYGNPAKQSPDGAVKHMGDNRTGDGNGDDEVVMIDLTKVDPRIVDLAVFVTIYDEQNQGLNFSRVSDAYIRVVNEATGTELARADLDCQFTNESAVQFGSIFRGPTDWEFKNIGAGFAGVDLGKIYDNYKPA